MKTPNTTSTFQEVFLTVVLLTVLSGGTSIYLAYQHTLSTQQQHIFVSLTTTWQMGVGEIFGLLGRKSTDLFRPQSEPEEDETK